MESASPSYSGRGLIVCKELPVIHWEIHRLVTYVTTSLIHVKQ
jgi:hypothetical protein